MSTVKSWIRKLRVQNDEEPSAERETCTTGNISTTPAEFAFRAVREPYEDSPKLAEFIKLHPNRPTTEYTSVRLEIVGCAGAGKRSLVNKLFYDDMNGGHRRQYCELICDPERSWYHCGGKKYELCLWPMPYPSLADAESEAQKLGRGHSFEDRQKVDGPGYIDTATHQGIIFAYDISSRVSFEDLTERYEGLLRHYKQKSSLDPVVVLGLKSDVSGNERQVSEEELASFAASRGCLPGECSARTGAGIDEVFSQIAEHVHAMRTRFEERGKKVGSLQ